MCVIIGCVIRERLVSEYDRTGDLLVDLGTDQTSCHNPFNGGYYPVQVIHTHSLAGPYSTGNTYTHSLAGPYSTGNTYTHTHWQGRTGNTYTLTGRAVQYR